VAEGSSPLRLFQPDMLPDPYPVYRRLQTEDPVHWHEPFGSWVVTRYDDVVAAFLEPRLSSERAGPMEAMAGSPDLTGRMDFRDPPTTCPRMSQLVRAWSSASVIGWSRTQPTR
jgi:cytochrome P450